MTMFKIEKDVPPPKARTAAQYPFAEMEIGDSFEVDAKLTQSARNAAHAYARRHPPMIFATRRTEQGSRIWRVE